MLIQLKRALRLTPADWAAVVAAVPALFYARIQFATLPIREVVEILQAAGQDVPSRGLDRVELERARRISWAVGATAARVPWRSDCLIRSIAASRLLRKRGISATFHLGVAREYDGTLAAHAWLCCGDVVVSSGPVERFTILIGPDGEETRNAN